MNKFEQIFYEFESVLKNLDVEFTEFADQTCERIDKLEERQQPTFDSAKTVAEADSPKRKAHVTEQKVEQLIKKEISQI